MLEDAIDCEMTFAEDLVSNGIAGLSLNDMRQYLEFIADQRLESLSIPARYNTKNPFTFMELQDMQEQPTILQFVSEVQTVKSESGLRLYHFVSLYNLKAFVKCDLSGYPYLIS